MYRFHCNMNSLLSIKVKYVANKAISEIQIISFLIVQSVTGISFDKEYRIYFIAFCSQNDHFMFGLPILLFKMCKNLTYLTEVPFPKFCSISGHMYFVNWFKIASASYFVKYTIPTTSMILVHLMIVSN